MKKQILTAAACVGLVACGGSETIGSASAQKVLGYVSYAGGNALPQAGTSYAFEVGNNSTHTAPVANAYLTAPSTLPNPPTTGRATFTGTYELRSYGSLVDIGGGERRGSGIDRSGPITLSAHFGDKTLDGDVQFLRPSGTSAGSLEIDGSFDSAGTLSGTTTFNGTTGTLGGDVGGDAAIGYFQGATSNSVFAGGFTASK